MKLWSILRKPNRLDELAAGDLDTAHRSSLLSDVRLQIKVLHLLAQSYMVFITAVVCFTSTHLALPYMYQDSETQLLFSKLLMYYLCGSGLINFVCVTFYAKRSHFGPGFSAGLPIRSSKRMLDSDWSNNGHSPADNDYLTYYWQECRHCEIKSPPRSRHCAICRTCVLKRDHHCFFTACCVGYYNQRFFISMAFFGMTAGLWGTYNFATYLNANYTAFFSLSFYRYFLPYCFISVTFGYISVSEFLTVLLFYIQITSSSGAGYYFWWQMFITYRGQTSVEALKRTKQFDKGPMKNFRSTLGTLGFLSVIFPIPFILLEGDGKSWELNTKAS